MRHLTFSIMANFNFKRFFRKAFQAIWKAVKFVGLVLLFTALFLGVIIWGILDWTIRWNPVCFVFWSIFFPRSMAESFACDGEPSGGADWPEVVFSLWPMVRREACAWHVYLLPMCLKKFFVMEDPQWFSDKAQIKAYRALKNEEDKEYLLSDMSEDARELFYTWATPKEKVALIALKPHRSWTQEDVSILLSEQAKRLLDKFFQNTPSQATINTLISYCEYGNPLAPDYLANAIWRDGMSPETLQKVVKMKNGSINEHMLRVAETRGQRDMVMELLKSRDMKEWRIFLMETPELSESAEAEMSVEMMKIFYETGHKLHGNNIMRFISVSSSDEYRKLVFKNEELSDVVMMYVKANADIYRLYLRTVKGI